MVSPRLGRRENDEVSKSAVRKAIDAFAAGEIVVVTDDNDRENEGDLILAAVHATPEKMAFIIRHTCGIVCAPLTAETARRLHLAPMVADNDAIHGTAFTVSVDYRHGTTTGISAEDRTATIRNLANGNAGRADFVRPGHIFPLIAKDGGVLMRSGHTEAALDLCRLGGLEPVAAICELVNDDGSVMRGRQVAVFAERHRLQRISVAELIGYRQAREKLVTRVAEFRVQAEVGELTGYAYVTPFDKVHHYAFVYGDIGGGLNVPTRLHRANVLEDLFGGAKPVHAALGRFRSAGLGVLVYLRDGASGVPASAIGEAETPSERERNVQWREVGLGAQILRDLGISSIRLLATRSRTYVGIAGFGIEIVETEPLDGE
jgi:3,4-dihydroxy 2-butanone 4-phosphate synthase/GTP cyclohydrolase II